MALTASEKMRRFRQKRDADPVKRAEFLKKEKERNKKRTKSAAHMSRREHKAQKTKWREDKRKQREKIKAAQNTITPPMSPIGDAAQGPSRQSVEGRRKRRNANAAMSRVNHSLLIQLKKEKKRSEMYRKRLARAVGNTSSSSNLTPKSKTNKFLHSSSAKPVKKALLFHNVLVEELKQKYRAANFHEKKTLSDIAAGKLLRKYKLRTQASFVLDISRKRSTGVKLRTSLTRRLRQSIQSFYERDDNSRMTTGLKQTVTFRKVRKQKRLLCDRVKNLHKKFLAENPFITISSASFWRLKPFWVKQPSEYERDTCLCKLHENFRMVVEQLHSLNILDSLSLENILKISSCKTESRSCMYGECKECSDFNINLSFVERNQPTTWYQWKYVKETRDIKGVGVKEVSMTRKCEQSGSIADLVDILYELLPKYKRHHYNMVNQLSHLRKVRKGLCANECAIHIDFAENFNGKMASEVHSMHFGASKVQITLHTGIVYFNDGHKSFCSLSDSLDHGPAAVWAHMNPILQDIRNDHPEIDTVHFFSDGPTSQYKQKGNFFLFSNLPFDHGFKSISWNFFEAGHGKGAPDGIGGSLKRRADEIVKLGSSIMNAEQFVFHLRAAESGVDLYTIYKQDITKVEKIKKLSSLNAVPGTMRIHQLISVSSGTIFYRDVSCSCPALKACKGHQCSSFTFPSRQEAKDVCLSVQPQSPSQCSDSSQDFLQATLDIAPFLEPSSLPLDSPPIEDVTLDEERRSYFKHVLEDLSSYDVAPHAVLLPVTATADGDCLPHTGSVFAFGNEDNQDELRARIIIELAAHQGLYLSHEYLAHGLNGCKNVRNLSANFAQYSEQFVINTVLTDGIVGDIYEKEVLSLLTPRSYMGIWQVFALASVLGITIFSVYPKLGNSSVRNDLHRVILPRGSGRSDEMIHVMWTSTRTPDMNPIHWVPNHFVPVMAIERPKVPTDETSTGSSQETSAQVHTEVSSKASITTQNPPDETTAHQLRTASSNTPPVPTSECTTTEGTHQLKTFQDLQSSLPDPVELIGKYVLVAYEGRAFPGKVLDIDEESDLYVECMTQITHEPNCFFWPRLKDRCWYQYDTDLLAVIPEPKMPCKNPRHKMVDTELWAIVDKHLYG